MTRTYTPKSNEIQRDWVVIDATDIVLGRLASHSAALLRGKHKAIFANHVDTGDFVVVVNAPEELARPGPAQEAEGLRRTGAPALGPAAEAVHPHPGRPVIPAHSTFSK